MVNSRESLDHVKRGNVGCVPAPVKGFNIFLRNVYCMRASQAAFEPKLVIRGCEEITTYG
jgi:hypothetical protein